MTDASPRLIIVSGLSGAGKSTALNALEDMGFNCIDNLPVALLQQFGLQVRAEPGLYPKIALGIDARAPGPDLRKIPELLDELKASGLSCQLLFLHADDSALVQRFSETRRRHPLAQAAGSLVGAISLERQLLEPLQHYADWVLDTTHTNIHELTHLAWKQLGQDTAGMSVVLQSFGFSHGVPADADFVFDVRVLPNPHWDTELRPLTGTDPRIAEWLEREARVGHMAADILGFLRTWLPEMERSRRSFVTVAIGCTGGRHRSVYLAERLAHELRGEFPELMVHHRELSK